MFNGNMFGRNPRVQNPVVNTPIQPMPGIGNGSGLGYRPPQIPQTSLGNYYGNNNVFDNIPNPNVGGGSRLQNNNAGNNVFDNIPNPFVNGSPSNPFYNPDQSLNADIYGGVYGQPNNTDFLPYGFDMLPFLPDYMSRQPGDLGAFQRNQPDFLRNQQPMSQPMGNVKDGRTATPQPIPIANTQPTPIRPISMDLILKMLMLNPGNFNF